LELERFLKPIPYDQDYPKPYFLKLCNILETKALNEIIIIPDTLTHRILNFTNSSPQSEENQILDIFRRKLAIEKFLPTQWKKKLFFLFESKEGIQQFFILHRFNPSEWVFHNFFYTTRGIVYDDKNLKNGAMENKEKLMNSLKLFLRTITDWTVKLKPGHEFFPKRLDFHEDHLITLEFGLNMTKFSRRIVYLVMGKYALEYNFEFKNPVQKYLDVNYEDVFPSLTEKTEPNKTQSLFVVSNLSNGSRSSKNISANVM